MLLKTFTAPECENLRAVCNFTEEEERIFTLRAKGKSIVEIQNEMKLSESTVNRRIKDVKKKINKVL